MQFMNSRARTFSTVSALFRSAPRQAVVKRSKRFCPRGHPSTCQPTTFCVSPRVRGHRRRRQFFVGLDSLGCLTEQRAEYTAMTILAVRPSCTAWHKLSDVAARSNTEQSRHTPHDLDTNRVSAIGGPVRLERRKGVDAFSEALRNEVDDSRSKVRATQGANSSDKRLR